MQLRDAVEEAVRRWHALETSRGEAPVIDFDCAPPADKPSPFDNRFAALDDLTRLRIEADTQHQSALKTQLDAHIAYLCALLGQQLPLDEYISLTQGCVPRVGLGITSSSAQGSLEMLSGHWESRGMSTPGQILAA